MRKIKAFDETLAQDIIGIHTSNHSIKLVRWLAKTVKEVANTGIMEVFRKVQTKRLHSSSRSKTSQQAFRSKRPRLRSSSRSSNDGRSKSAHVLSIDAAKARRVALWEQVLLTNLCDLLKELSPLCRHSVIARKLSQRQRLMLEHWMLAKGRESSKDARCIAGSMLHIKRKRAPFHRACARPLHLDSPLPAVVETHRTRGLVKHIRKDTRDCYYSVVLTVGRLRLQTREDRDRELMANYHEALISVQKRMIGVGAETFELAFRFHIDAVLRERGLEARKMGLRFSVCLAALWLPRPLLTPPFSAEGQALDAGLRAWRRLGEARGRVLGRGTVLQVLSPEEIACSWARVRAAYLDIMEEAGHCREQVASKLLPLEAAQRERQEVQLRRWNCARMAAEEKMQRQIRQQERSLARVAALAEQLQKKEKRTLRAIDRLLTRWEHCLSRRHHLASMRLRRKRIRTT